MKHLLLVFIFTLTFVGVHCGDFVISLYGRLKKGRNKYSPIAVQPTSTPTEAECSSLFGTRNDLKSPAVEFQTSTTDKIEAAKPPILVVSSARAADVKANWASLYYGKGARKVFFVVNYLEFDKYKTELADKAVIVGCKPTADVPVVDEEDGPSTTMFGFGLNRYCAQKFAQASKFAQYWMMDDNVLKIGDKTLESYELEMTQNSYLVIGASVSETGGSFMEQVYLFSSALPYYFSPMFQLSKEDVSLTSFLALAGVKIKADASLKVEKLTTMNSHQNFQRDFSKIFATAKAVNIKQGKTGTRTPLLEWMYYNKDAYNNVQYKDYDDLVKTELELNEEDDDEEEEPAPKELTLPLAVGVSNAVEILLSDCVQRYAMPALFGADLTNDAIRQLPQVAKAKYDKNQKDKQDAALAKRRATIAQKKAEQEATGKKRKPKRKRADTIDYTTDF